MMKGIHFTTVALVIPGTFGFAPQGSIIGTSVLQASTLENNGKALYDPLGLYPSSSPERKAGIIKPLETFPEPSRAVTDPLGLYQDRTDISSSVEMSASLPFLASPTHLDGSLPGDRGFDPFNFAADEGSLEWYRQSEQKHGRIAMLASVGWPLAELFHKAIAESLGLPSLLASHDRVPSVLNDGLSHVPFAGFWIPVIAAAAALEFRESFNQDSNTPKDRATGQSVTFAEEAEIFNGRLAMLAITGFALQEYLFQDAVIDQFPIFFKPINVAMEQLMNSGVVSL